jgi:ketosteroid isomerase-like protein
LEQAIALLSDVLEDRQSGDAGFAPWREPLARSPLLQVRVSATDRLSWWFRPSTGGRDPWHDYFDAAPQPRVTEPALMPAEPSPGAEAPGRRAALRLLLAEPDEEMIDSEADAVVTCLYDFVHALGRGDVRAAIDDCVAPDYHVMENDVEVDRDGLAAQLHAELDRLRRLELAASLVEIPEPILHPAGILVYAELQLEASRGSDRQTIVHRRLAVFRQGRDRRWRISALSPVSRS